MVEITCRAEEGGLVLHVRGELTEPSVSVVDACVSAAVDSADDPIIVDVRAVTRVDRAATATLAEIATRLARQGRTFVVRNLDGWPSHQARAS